MTRCLWTAHVATSLWGPSYQSTHGIRHGSPQFSPGVPSAVSAANPLGRLRGKTSPSYCPNILGTQCAPLDKCAAAGSPAIKLDTLRYQMQHERSGIPRSWMTRSLKRILPAWEWHSLPKNPNTSYLLEHSVWRPTKHAPQPQICRRAWAALR